MKIPLLLSLVFLSSATAAADSHDVYGLWRSEAGDAHIEISDCGDGTPCGTLVWVDPAMTPTDRDAKNRDESLRDRALVGIPIVWGYSKGRTKWRGGSVYNPEDGKTFKSSMRKRDDDTLELKGCIGPLCRTNIWTPVRTGPGT